ncbi:MAG: sugar phosphate isomerase/epimerase [Chloroflexi bacterium]|nr:sugar phosphate isomerase/epimerase [Chloroflexota bacterium]
MHSAAAVIGINHFGKRPLDETLPALARHGYGAVDYSAAAGRLAGDVDALAVARRLTRDLGLSPAATHFRSFGFAFLTPGGRRDTFLRESVEDVRVAAYLGVRAIAFHLGNDLATQPGVPERDLATANAEALRPAVRVAEQEGVVVALENHCHGFGDRWEHLVAVADLLASPAVGFTLDSGHAVVAGQDPALLARRMGARLALTHLHDNHGTADTHRPAGRCGPNGEEDGAAAVDWPALIRALREVGYPERNVWLLEGGTQLPGDDVERLLAAHRACFVTILRHVTDGNQVSVHRRDAESAEPRREERVNRGDAETRRAWSFGHRENRENRESKRIEARGVPLCALSAFSASLR